ncbi:MAG: hypothetical protein MRJ68_16260 [Nitrospira sp.]|nr:hypothetical protein [Nitrospira sp.]
MARTTTAVAKRTKEPTPEPINPLKNIEGIAFEMEDKVNHTIAIARTALDQLADDEEANGQGALELIVYRLKQIADCHELIVKNLQYHNSATTKE